MKKKLFLLGTLIFIFTFLSLPSGRNNPGNGPGPDKADRCKFSMHYL